MGPGPAQADSFDYVSAIDGELEGAVQAHVLDDVARNGIRRLNMRLGSGYE